ncbi:TonB-dependent receptor domain-containing protein [Thalassotalea piscium]|uniref:Outer membrane receptor protein involved in Fe transport n=1 Tax=Thalassotalea piscium TaxID=1230533 RepID=A0A7X0TT26_9GAMM|nr:TonB-dependent receptor [Thalassotalea piscium]MBB6542792.1 outer membrane receptor protein involved in Fe transport [Thalassotalea piscium]
MKHIKSKPSYISKALIIAGIISAPMITVADEMNDEKLEKIEVTGSRIKRLDMESASPVSIISAAEISMSGISNVENLLQEMSFSAGVAGNATNAYWTSGGYGTAQVNLRGLGIKRTLVLFNGRRVVGGGTGANSSVDLNMIPTSMIERIEVLKDGASAIYGADAVAGVVNIITKKEFEGAEFNAKAGFTDKGDGGNQDLNLTLGGNFDKGNAVLSLNYSNTEAVRQSDRVDCAKFGTEDGKFECFGSSTTEGGRALLADGSQVQFNQHPDTGANGDWYGPYDSAEHSFNWTPYLNAVSPMERINVSSFVNYEISDTLKLFTETMYTKRKGQQIATPRNGFAGIKVDSDFAYNPTGQNLEFQRRRNTELGVPYFFQETDTIRIVLGVAGELNNGWGWDFSYNYGRNTGKDGWTYDIDPDKASQTLNDSICTYDNSNGIPCGDWFGLNELSQEVIDYVKYRREGTGGNDMRSWTANLYGDLYELPAGTLGFAIGAEKRTEKGWRDPDSTVLANGQEDAINGNYDVTEAFVELSVPLLAELPLVKNLTAEIAARYSDYSTVGAESTYKLGITWSINDSLMVRGVQSTSFRAPVITELFGGTNGENLRTIDPCENASGAIAKNCQAAGIPENFVQDGTTILTSVGGNPSLGAESADTTTIGLVWEPELIEGLSTTFDYFNIEIDESITSVNGSDMLKLCYEDPIGNAQFCNTFTRHPITNQVNELNQRPVNAAKEKVSGVDFNIKYKTQVLGLITKSSLDITRLLTHESTPFAGQPTIDKVGFITEDQGSYTEWRSNLSVSVLGDDWQATYSLRYIGGADDVNGGDFDPLGKSVDSLTYSDIGASYMLNNELVISAGIDNLFDKKAPYLTSWNDANTDVMTYDLLGRRGFVDPVTKSV